MEEHYFQVELNIEVDEVYPAVLQALELESVVKQTLHKAGIALAVTLSLLITDDERIQGLNKQYRQQDKPTDVLSFPLLDKPLVNAPSDQLWMFPGDDGAAYEAKAKFPAFVTPPELATNLGDIVISWPTVLRQAREAGHSPIYELLYLLSHGVLHLVGYDDQTEAGYQAMVDLQQATLQTMKIPM